MREGKAVSPRGTAKISAAIRLRTAELFLETGQFKLAAAALFEETGEKISPTTVRGRLLLENITTSSSQKDIEGALARMRAEAEEERAAGINLPVRSSGSDELTEDEQIATLQAFVENYRYAPTGRVLNISGDAAKNRLIKILGEKNAYPPYARRVLEDKKRERERRNSRR